MTFQVATTLRSDKAHSLGVLSWEAVGTRSPPVPNLVSWPAYAELVAALYLEQNLAATDVVRSAQKVTSRERELYDDLTGSVLGHDAVMDALRSGDGILVVARSGRAGIWRALPLCIKSLRICEPHFAHKGARASEGSLLNTEWYNVDP